MAASDVILPPISKISLLGIWVETVCYGINSVLYGVCLFVLLRERDPKRWVLLVVSTILFLLSTIHVGASLQQLLEAFAYVSARVPDYSTVYWLDYTSSLYTMKSYLFTILMLIHNFICVWRLYVVFMGNWKAVVFPVVLVSGCVGSGFAAASVYVADRNALAMVDLIISGWAFGFTLNVCVTVAIVTRLWWMGRTMAALTTTPVNHNTTLLGLFATNIYLAASAISAAAQIFTTSTLLIVAQAGVYHISGRNSTITLDEITFRVDASRDSLSDLPPCAIYSRQRTVTFAYGAGV